ncbi:glutathione S-transferase family protein [Devosia sp.]|uniref:glutathione S-transferase family protein n=1 Tax=Devosia sp. TaxID=1871048 RepID=UPI003A8F294B
MTDTKAREGLKLDVTDQTGRFNRGESKFRNWITADGSAGPTGEDGFVAEPDRYHLYVSLACPWANRTLIMRHLKGLEEMIDVSVVHWFMGKESWTFDKTEGATGDKLYGSRIIRDIYQKAVPGFDGRVTVPVLWDKKRETIVNNESSEIIRMLNTAFDGIGATPGDYYPEALRAEIDEVNDRVYHTVNNGVYKAGFATKQDAYEEAVTPLFESLDWLENRLEGVDYLVGNQLTEADIRLFTTLVRFDAVYHGHFKCNIRRIVDYPNLWRYTRLLYNTPGFAETVDFTHIKSHYYASHTQINPTGIVPVGPDLDFSL